MKLFSLCMFFLSLILGSTEVIANVVSVESYKEVRLDGNDILNSGFSFDLYQKILDKDELSTLSISLHEKIDGNRLQWVEVYLYENERIICRYVEQSFSYKKDGRRGVLLQLNLRKVGKIEIHAVYGQTKYIFYINPSLI